MMPFWSKMIEDDYIIKGPLLAQMSKIQGESGLRLNGTSNSVCVPQSLSEPHNFDFSFPHAASIFNMISMPSGISIS